RDGDNLRDLGGDRRRGDPHRAAHAPRLEPAPALSGGPMSFDHWWFGVLLEPADHARIAPGFAAALEEAVLSPQAKRALDAWRPRTADFTRAGQSARHVEVVNAFIWAFNLPGFEEFAEEVFTDDALRVDLLDEQKLFRFAMIPRNTPVSIVWHAL